MQCTSQLFLDTHFADFVASLAILSDTTPASEDSKLRCLFSVNSNTLISILVAFQVFDEDRDGFITNAELFRVLRVILADINDVELQQVVDRTILQANKGGEGHISFEEFKEVQELYYFLVTIHSSF